MGMTAQRMWDERRNRKRASADRSHDEDGQSESKPIADEDGQSESKPPKKGKKPEKAGE